MTFNDENSHREFKLKAPVTATDAAALLDTLRQKFSPKTERQTRSSPTDAAGALMDQLTMLRPFSLASEEEMTRYNRGCKDYLNALESYYKEWPQHENVRRRTLPLNLTLWNRGTLRADDIDVILHVPDGMAVYDEESRPRFPREPQPPEGPKIGARNAGARD